jgi:hypothetical protein
MRSDRLYAALCKIEQLLERWSAAPPGSEEETDAACEAWDIAAAAVLDRGEEREP